MERLSKYDKTVAWFSGFKLVHKPYEGRLNSFLLLFVFLKELPTWPLLLLRFPLIFIEQDTFMNNYINLSEI